MKYLPLLWGGLFRRKGRTFLTLASIGVAFMLFGLLQAVERVFEAGDYLFYEGEEGDYMYLVLEGQIRIEVGSQEVAVIGPGKSTGEMAILDRRPRDDSSARQSPDPVPTEHSDAHPGHDEEQADLRVRTVQQRGGCPYEE